MINRESIPSLFVTARGALATEGGGVQVCTREYLATLKAGGFDLELMPFDLDSRIKTRIRNKLFPDYYPRQVPQGLEDQIYNRSVQRGMRYIFFNFNMYPQLIRCLRHRLGPHVKIVLLSMGLESTDYCVEHHTQCDEFSMQISARKARILGGRLLYESKARHCLDGILCVSNLDAELERWLGARSPVWVPRVILESQLDSKPVDRRVGCVSTLNHPPNRQGLLQLFNEMSKLELNDLRFRLVGQPKEEGQAMAMRYKFVDYLGPLDDSELRTEAGSWCCFVHPLFVFAKGYSTKLAVALGWRLPIATTAAGVRGYCWDDSILPLAKTPAQLAQFVIDRSDCSSFEKFRGETLGIIKQTPSVTTVGESIRDFLDRLGDPQCHS